MRATTAPDQLYEADFYAWTRQQALALRRLARTRPNLPLDLEHIAEEIQDLGKSERDTVYSVAQRVIEHFLLIEHSPATDQRLHWADEIDTFRDQMKRKLSPTIRRHLKRDLGEVYADGRRIVGRKMGRYGEQEAAAALPARCPYTLEQVLGDWLPETETRSP
jgi:Domain of unknown function DUF29